MPKSTPPDSQRKRQRVAARERALERARRREIMLEFVARGMDRADIARATGVSLRTVFRDVNRALDDRRPLATDRFLRLQVERLNRTMQGLSGLLETGDVRAAAPILAILDRLERYHGLQTLATATDAPRLSAATPLPLALGRAAEETSD